MATIEYGITAPNAVAKRSEATVVDPEMVALQGMLDGVRAQTSAAKAETSTGLRKLFHEAGAVVFTARAAAARAGKSR